MIQDLVQAAAGAGTANEIVPYASSAVLVMYAQQSIKAMELYQRFVKAFPGADKWAHRFVAAVGAFVAAVGIGYTFDYDMNTGGTLTLTLPTIHVLLHGAKDFAVVYLFQQAAYDMTRRGDMPPPTTEKAAQQAEAAVVHKE